MLIGARDEDGEGCMVFDVPYEGCLTKNKDGRWHLVNWTVGKYVIERSPIAEPFCRDIPPGEKRVIDLAKSTIVHVQPKKTAVQELVEKANDLLLSVSFIDGPDSKNFRIVSVESVSDLHFALARVRQEGGV